MATRKTHPSDPRQGVLFGQAGVVRQNYTVIVPPELKAKLLGGIDRMGPEPATIVLRQHPTPSITFLVGPLELTFKTPAKIVDEALTVYGVRCDEIPRIAIATAERVIGGVMVRSAGWSRLLQAECYNPEKPEAPDENAWVSMPPIAHLRAILPLAESCFCDSSGSFTTATAHASATTRPLLRVPKTPAAILVSARALFAALKADNFTHVCLFKDHLWMRSETTLARISHSPNLTGLTADTLIEICQGYGIILRASFPNEVQNFPFPEPRGALRFRGAGRSGKMESDYGGMEFLIENEMPGFDFVVADVEGIRPFLMNRTCDIYVPQKANMPVGFRMGPAWYWSVSLP